MRNFLLGLSKFVLGIILAMLIMALAGASMLRYFMARTAEQPPRPTYDNDAPEERAEPSPPTANADIEVEENVDVAEPEPEPEPEDSEPSPDGSYSAYVNQPVGLILRNGPGTDYGNIGGIGYNESITVIGEESGWLNVVLSSGEEGWIKEGNTTRE